MPVPKKRHSNTRTRTRRANWKLKALNLAVCPQCKSPILPHHACPVCGTYKGRTIIKIETKEKKGKKETKKTEQRSDKSAPKQGGEEKPKS
jgi:large subunit ribosomal protein L32